MAISKLNENLLLDILFYLPVISLLRFKTVCKDWCSAINSKIFSDLYLMGSDDRKDAIVLKSQMNLSLLSGNNPNMHFSIRRLFPEIHMFEIINSCNGVVLLECRSAQIILLWNPATKNFRNLPRTAFSFQSKYLLVLYCHKKTKEYCVLRISLNQEFVNHFTAQVYELSVNLWRIVNDGGENQFPVLSSDRFDDVECNNEFAMWFGKKVDKSSIIFYFNLITEVHGTISLPLEHNDTLAQSFAIGFVNGKISYIRRLITGSYEIWSLNGVEEKDSWNLIHKLEEDKDIGWCVYVVFMKISYDGQKIYISKFGTYDSEDGGGLYVYDMDSGELCTQENVINIFDYSESVVSLKM